MVVGFGDSVTGFVIGFVVTVVGFLGVVVGFWVEHEFINNPVKMSGIYFSLLIFIRAKIEENVLFFKFFNVELEKIRDMVEKITDNEADFKMTVLAEQYNETLRLLR